MKIFIIGKHGQLAQSLCNHLDSSNIEYLSLSQSDCDITDYDRVQKIVKDFSPTVIINTSAYNLVPQAEDEPAKAFNINCFAVSNLATLCKRRNIQFITFSTDYVFDGSKGKPYLETDHPHPLQMYGLSKFAGEIACLNANANSLILRTNGLYGGLHGSPQKNGNFVLNIIRDASKQETLSVSNAYTVNPTSAKELAKATLALINQGSSRGIYHLASEGECTWFEFAQVIVATMKLKCTIQPTMQGSQTGMKRPAYSVLANTRAKACGIVLPDWKSSVIEYLQEIT